MAYGVSRQQYFAIKNSLSRAERDVISFYELQWIMKSRVPTIEEVASYCKLKHTEINYMLTRKMVQKALDQRGVPWKQHTQEELTPTQVAVAITMSNFADTRTNEAKLDQMGVTSAQYYAWLNDPAFKNMVQTLADQNLQNIRPTAIGEFTKLINQGDWNAVKFYLQTTGELQGNEAPQSEVLIKMLIEIIQKHVKDPEIIIAIANDIKLASANRTLEVAVQPQLTNFIEEDEELADARKQLGV